MITTVFEENPYTHTELEPFLQCFQHIQNTFNTTDWTQYNKSNDTRRLLMALLFIFGPRQHHRNFLSPFNPVLTYAQYFTRMWLHQEMRLRNFQVPPRVILL